MVASENVGFGSTSRELEQRGRRLCLYQPNYFPRLHYIARILDTDVFDMADDLQFSRSHAMQAEKGLGRTGRSWSYQAHTPIKTSAGRVDLGVPVHKHLLPICESEIDYTQKWVRKHLRTLESSYGKSPGYRTLSPEIEGIIAGGWRTLGALTTLSVLWALAKVVSGRPVDLSGLTVAYVNDLLVHNDHPFRLRTVVLGSDVRKSGLGNLSADARIIAACRNHGASEFYCGGLGNTAYMELERYRQAGIDVMVQAWKCSRYRQRYGRDFIANLSIIDLLMNEDRDQWIRTLGGAAQG